MDEAFFAGKIDMARLSLREGFIARRMWAVDKDADERKTKHKSYKETSSL